MMNAPPTCHPSQPLGAWLRQLALDAGADDAGLVRLERPELDDQRADICRVLPGARSLLSFVCKMHRESIRATDRSVANVEFHHVGDDVNEIGRAVARACESRGIRAINATMGFPMEADRWPEKMWLVSHKPIAVAAGLGKMGIHRNVIHPRFGSFILLGTVVLDAEIEAESTPLAFNPCLECKLCVAACPTGAIGADGHFDVTACYTHNYREFMGGFSDWVENIADSPNARHYRSRVSDAETVSMWQSLAFGPNYKAAYCLSVCPAGEDVASPFQSDRTGFLDRIVRPLQAKAETIYVVPGSDAESYVSRRFPAKRPKPVSNGIRPKSIEGFLQGMRHTFQRGRSAGLDAVYHFQFHGREPRAATVTIRNRTIQVEDGLTGTPNLRLTADSDTWLRFLAKETSLSRALILRRVTFRGSPRLLRAFARCFPT